MNMEMETLLRMFVALFVVMNALPLLPLIMNMTSDLRPQQRQRHFRNVLLLGAAAGSAFVFGGPALFKLIGISLADLRMAGGIVLLVFATHDMLFSAAHRKERDAEPELHHDHAPSLVPLAIPILVGPSTLTTLVVLADAYGIVRTIAVLLANIAINWLTLSQAPAVLRILGDSFTASMGKIYSLLLAAIAVSMIRHGITEVMIATGNG